MRLQTWLLLLPAVLVVLLNCLDSVGFASDNIQFFYWTMYHVKSLIHGVFPLWNPFHAWGSPDGLDIRFLGDFNPIYLGIPLLTFLGCPASTAYLIVLTVYFLIGCLGFYFVALYLLKDKFLATLAYILLMFSSFKIAMAYQLCVVIITVTTIWFFVFCFDLMQAKNLNQMKRAVFGLTFVLMMIATSYIPFYFITTVMAVMLSLIIFSPKVLGDFIKCIWRFICMHPVFSFCCCIALVLFCIPSYLSYQMIQDPQFTLNVDRADPNSSNVAAVTMDMINAGSLTSMISWEELFSDFKSFVNHRGYVSVFAYILLFLSLINQSTRQQRVLLFSAFCVFLVSVAGLSPVLGFLYQHVFIFKLFRNYFFFIQLIMVFFILFVVGELKAFMSIKQDGMRAPLWLMIYTMLVHGVFFVFLSQFDNVPLSSYLVLATSCFWFILWLSGLVKLPRNIFIAGLCGVALIGPIQVMHYFDKNCEGKPIYPKNEMTFHFQRPLPGNGFNEEHGFHRRVKIYKDESGFVSQGYWGTTYAFELHSHVNKQELSQYVQYKFILYDHVTLSRMASPNWGQLSENMALLKNDAQVYNEKALRFNKANGFEAKAKPIVKESSMFKLVDFNLNNISFKTNFSKRQFLVYNDAYHKDWHVYIDGKEKDLFRVNWAFKGVWVEEGEHQVRFVYKNAFIQMSYLLIVFLAFVWLFVLLIYFRV